MAVGAHALITLEDAKTRLGIVDDSRDAALEGLIDEVSRALLRATDREYAPQTDGVTRRFVLRDRSRVIDLLPYDARAVTEVVLSPGGSNETTLTASQYRLEPLPSPDGVYFRIRLDAAISSWSAFGSVLVDVTGDWGWPSVPDDVRGWALEIIEDRWKQDFAIYADADGLINEQASTSSSGGPVTIPYRIRDEIEASRRVVLGSV